MRAPKRKAWVKCVRTKYLKEIATAGFTPCGKPYATTDKGTDYGDRYDEVIYELAERSMKEDEKDTARREREEYAYMVATYGKWCPSCDKVKKLTEEHWHRRAGGKGWRSYCRPCRNLITKTYASKDKIPF